MGFFPSAQTSEAETQFSIVDLLILEWTKAVDERVWATGTGTGTEWEKQMR